MRKELTVEQKAKEAAHKKQYRQDNRAKISLRQKKYREEHKAEASLYNKQYRQEHKAGKAGAAAYQKQYRQKHKAKARHGNLVRKYGIGLKEYDELFITQEGCCAICGTHQTELSRALVVDHNHETGEIRGLLCHKCNLTLGYVNDNIRVLVNAIKYLEKNV
jgi:hypothetical protein